MIETNKNTRLAHVTDYGIVDNRLHILNYKYTNPYTGEKLKIQGDLLTNLPTHFVKNKAYKFNFKKTTSFEAAATNSSNCSFGENTKPLYYKIQPNATNGSTIIVNEYQIFERERRTKNEIFHFMQEYDNNFELKDVLNSDTQPATILMLEKYKIDTREYNDGIIVYPHNGVNKMSFDKGQDYKLTPTQQTAIFNSIKWKHGSKKPTRFILATNSINSGINSGINVNGGRKIRNGPRGGKYYMKGGNKVYIK